MNKYLNGIDKDQLDAEELKTLAEFEGKNLVSNFTPKRQSELQAAAKETNKGLKKTFTTRLYQDDIDALKQRAQEQGIAHNTLLSSILHRYLTGQFFEKP